MKAVNAGEIRSGDHLPLLLVPATRPSPAPTATNVELHYFGNQDPGAFVSVSGAGVLKSSKHAADAQKLLAYMTGKEGQQVLADSNAMEYAVGNGVAADPTLKPLSRARAAGGRPRHAQRAAGRSTLMQQAGLL